MQQSTKQASSTCNGLSTRCSRPALCSISSQDCHPFDWSCAFLQLQPSFCSGYRPSCPHGRAEELSVHVSKQRPLFSTAWQSFSDQAVTLLSCCNSYRHFRPIDIHSASTLSLLAIDSVWIKPRIWSVASAQLHRTSGKIGQAQRK